MFQSPFGGVSMFLNILIVAIGSSVRFLAQRSKFFARVSHGFFSQFSDAANDTLSRRIFAFTIPFAMFIIVLAAIGSAFLVLARDDNRIPAYQFPGKTFDYLSTQRASLERISPFLFRVNLAPAPAVVALSREESNLEKSSTKENDLESTEPPSLALGGGGVASTSMPTRENISNATATQILISFLEKNNIDSSEANRIEIAKLLKVSDYTGTPAQDIFILKQLQELSARTAQ